MAAKKRKGLSKAVRFEVLKRDKFTCQYCGAKSPDVLLHVDHIRPVAEGGPDDLMNLIAACEACNLGKSATPLSSDAAVAKARNQAAELQARREQIEMMAEWQASLVDLEAQQLERAHAVIKQMMPGWQLSEERLTDVRRYLAEHGFEAVLGQFRSSCARLIRWADGRPTQESVADAIQHAVTALRWRKLNQEDPQESQARYVRGILRNRLRYVNERDALALTRAALRAGYRFEDLKAIAIDVRNWTEWEREMVKLLEGAQEPGR